LSIPDIKPDDSHVELGRYFDNSGFGSQEEVFE